MNRFDPTLIMLFAGMMLFTGILIWCEYAFKDDGQVFQVIAGLVAGFSGSFFTVIKQRTGDKPDSK